MAPRVWVVSGERVVFVPEGERARIKLQQTLEEKIKDIALMVEETDRKLQAMHRCLENTAVENTKAVHSAPEEVLTIEDMTMRTFKMLAAIQRRFDIEQALL